jgi:hypothetical protein
VVDDNELRRRAQPLIDRPPYEPLPLGDVRQRAAARTRRARVQIISAFCAVAVVAATVGVVSIYGQSDGHNVAVPTTYTAAPVTVPVGTSIADLRFTPIAGPDGDKNVAVYATGDQFLAVEGDQGFERAWIGDANGRWRAIAVPDVAQGLYIRSVQQLHGHAVVVLDSRNGPVVLEGPSLADLKVSRWTSDSAALPAVKHPIPPRGHGITVSAVVESTAVGERGILMVGTVSAGLNRDLLPKSVRDTLARRPGRIDVRDGRVIATVSGIDHTPFDRPARALGLTAAEIDYLSRPDDSRIEVAVWGAAWGRPIRRLPAAGLDRSARLVNPALTRVSDGFVMTSDTSGSSEMWWSRDGRSWRYLTVPPRKAWGVIEVGSRWAVPSAGIVSDDEGRSWIPIDLAGDLAAHSGTTVFEPGGTSAFGLLGASNGLDVPSLTVFVGRMLYSPDGMHWSSVSLADALGVDANIPTIAVGDRSAILEAGLRAPGVQPQRFWLITRRG